MTEAEAQEAIKSLRATVNQFLASKRTGHLTPEQVKANPRIAAESQAGQIPVPPTPGVLDTIKGTLSSIQGKDVTNALREGASGLTLGLFDKASDLTGLDSPEERQQRRAENPAASQVARLAGGVAGAAVGPVRALGAGARGLLGMAETAVPALAKTALGRVGAQAATGALSGGAAEGIDAATQGKPILESAGMGAAAGGVLGGGIQAIGEGAKWVGRAIAGTKYGKAADILKPPPPPNGAPQSGGPSATPPPAPPAAPAAGPVPQAPPPAPTTIQGFMAAQQAEQAAAQAAQQQAARETLSLKGTGLHGHGLVANALAAAIPAGAIIYNMAQHPVNTTLTTAALLAARNAGPIGGRLVLPAARGVGNALTGLGGRLGGAVEGIWPGIESDFADAVARVRRQR